MDLSEPIPEPYPARMKMASGSINGVPTEVMSIQFSDKIMFTISQGGRLAHWVHVPLSTPSPASMAAMTSGSFSHEEADQPELLPMPHLTATTILGGMREDIDTLGQLYATQVASMVTTKDPDERRTVVVGIGLENSAIQAGLQSRDGFMDMVELVSSCL